jgi:membrane associated rhomboid family serine protease
MQGLWQRFVSSLTPAVRWTLSIWTIFFLLDLALGFFHIVDVGGWLMLTGPAILHGQVWRVATYALLPSNLMDLMMNGISVVVFGGMLERMWLRRDFLLYCLVAAVGAGLVKIALQSISPTPMLGPSPIAFALMAATGRLFAHERMILPPSFEMTMRTAVILLAALSFVFMVCMAGWVNALIRVSGGICGILYLWLRSDLGQPREARPAVSQRINRLEL